MPIPYGGLLQIDMEPHLRDDLRGRTHRLIERPSRHTLRGIEPIARERERVILCGAPKENPRITGKLHRLIVMFPARPCEKLIRPGVTRLRCRFIDFRCLLLC